MTARQRSVWLVAAIAVACMLATSGAAAQSLAARFSIATVKDSTIVFAIGDQRWVKPGLQGRAVDPARSDELVAHFRVLQVEGGQAEAVITGQIRSLIDAHVAILDRPRRPFWRQTVFWIGSLTGLILGAAAGASL